MDQMITLALQTTLRRVHRCDARAAPRIADTEMVASFCHSGSLAEGCRWRSHFSSNLILALILLCLSRSLSAHGSFCFGVSPADCHCDGHVASLPALSCCPWGSLAKLFVVAISATALALSCHHRGRLPQFLALAVLATVPCRRGFPVCRRHDGRIQLAMRRPLWVGLVYLLALVVLLGRARCYRGSV